MEIRPGDPKHGDFARGGEALPRDERLGKRGAVEEGEGGVGVELGVAEHGALRRDSVPGTCNCTGTRNCTEYQVRSSRRIESVAAVHGDSRPYRYPCTWYRYPVRPTRRVGAPRGGNGSRLDAVQGTATGYIGTGTAGNPRVLARRPRCAV